MRRTDELRKKFAAKGKASSRAAEGEKMAFVDRLNEILAAEKHARATSKVFIDKLFCEFEAARPAEMDEWIRTKIADLFVSIAEPPQWVFEPAWCFGEDGHPLQFSHQFKDQEGTSFYVFLGYKQAVVSGVEGKARYWKMAAQDPEGIIRLEGEILG